MGRGDHFINLNLVFSGPAPEIAQVIPCKWTPLDYRDETLYYSRLEVILDLFLQGPWRWRRSMNCDFIIKQPDISPGVHDATRKESQQASHSCLVFSKLYLVRELVTDMLCVTSALSGVSSKYVRLCAVCPGTGATLAGLSSFWWPDMAKLVGESETQK